MLKAKNIVSNKNGEHIERIFIIHRFLEFERGRTNVKEEPVASTEL